MTFSHEASLPPLPLPALGALRDHLPRLLAPLADEATCRESASSLEQFLQTDGLRLYQRLTQWKKEQGANNSWLLPLWDRQYLGWRGPLPVDMNYFVILDGPIGKSAGKAAFCLAAAMQHLFNQSLPAEATKAGPLSMRQFRSMFYTRLPYAGCDSLLHCAHGCELQASVVCNGEWFILSLSDASGALHPAHCIDEALDTIRALATNDIATLAPIGAMTTGQRERAAFIRAALLTAPRNQMNLQSIEKTAFTLCLDPPQCNRAALCLNALCGPAENRWFDKSLQIVCPQGGPVALNMEHAGCDASAWCYLLERSAELAEKAPVTDSPPVIRRLAWDISPELQTMLRKEAHIHAERAASLHIVPCEAGSLFGKNAIKALQCSPDAFVQIAMQCAQYAVFGTMHSCYEAFSMRGYAGGRTECARPSSPEALSLAKAVADKAPCSSLFPLFSAAVQEHGRRLALCREGQAVERLIFGLKAMHTLYDKGLGMDTPPFFANRGLMLMQKNMLSTSGLGTPCASLFGFGPVEEYGLGAGYTMRGNALSLVLSAYTNKGPKPDAFAETLMRVMEIFAAVLNAKG